MRTVESLEGGQEHHDGVAGMKSVCAVPPTTHEYSQVKQPPSLSLDIAMPTTPPKVSLQHSHVKLGAEGEDGAFSSPVLSIGLSTPASYGDASMISLRGPSEFTQSSASSPTHPARWSPGSGDGASPWKLRRRTEASPAKLFDSERARRERRGGKAAPGPANAATASLHVQASSHVPMAGLTADTAAADATSPSMGCSHVAVGAQGMRALLAAFRAELESPGGSAGQMLWKQRLSERRHQVMRSSADKESVGLVLCSMAKVLMDEGTHESRFREAVELCKAAAHSLRKRSLGLAYRLGIALHRCHRLDDAILVYKAALKHPSSDDAFDALLEAGAASPPRVPLRCRVLVNLGVALEAKNKIAKAIPKYREAVCLWPEYPNALKLLGSALMVERQLQEAEHHLRVAVTVQPFFPDAWCDLGVCRRHRGNARAASVALMHAVAQQPQHCIAHWNLSLAQRDCGLEAEAMASCNTVLDISPSLWAAHVHKALLLTMARDGAGAADLAVEREVQEAIAKAGGDVDNVMSTLKGIVVGSCATHRLERAKERLLLDMHKQKVPEARESSSSIGSIVAFASQSVRRIASGRRIGAATLPVFVVGDTAPPSPECVVRIKPEWELDHEGGASEDFSSPEHGAGREVTRGRARKDVLEPTHLQFAAPPILEVLPHTSLCHQQAQHPQALPLSQAQPPRCPLSSASLDLVSADSATPLPYESCSEAGSVAGWTNLDSAPSIVDPDAEAPRDASIACPPSETNDSDSQGDIPDDSADCSANPSSPAPDAICQPRAWNRRREDDAASDDVRVASPARLPLHNRVFKQPEPPLVSLMSAPKLSPESMRKGVSVTEVNPLNRSARSGLSPVMRVGGSPFGQHASGTCIDHAKMAELVVAAEDRACKSNKENSLPTQMSEAHGAVSTVEEVVGR
mmetsp:Transcript_38707/g.72603  ORF Transcript_38707/g.72603 Transcript_38707/m.72603 type:complete len:918 (+) Transcript_38707:343-3096(+)